MIPVRPKPRNPEMQVDLTGGFAGYHRNPPDGFRLPFPSTLKKVYQKKGSSVKGMGENHFSCPRAGSKAQVSFETIAKVIFLPGDRQKTKKNKKSA
jgi:hypothetical protein